MLLLEHHGKSLLKRHGFRIPVGTVVDTAEGLNAALEALPEQVVLKAQIPTGRRSKAGGILFADNAYEARKLFGALKASTIAGHEVENVLVEERLRYSHERYAAISTTSGKICLLFARDGGIDIEEVTAVDASNLESIAVDILNGPDPAKLQGCFDRLGYETRLYAAYAEIAERLYGMCVACDATLIEVNPIVECDNSIYTLDARIVIDPAALDRQPAILSLLSSRSHPVESQSSGWLRLKKNPQGGGVGLIGLGSGLNMAIMDWISEYGATIRTLVDVDDAISSGRAEEGFSIALHAFDNDADIKSILINIITCGYRLDDIVLPLLRALQTRTNAQKPTTLHLRGNAMTGTPVMLAAAGRTNSRSLCAAIEQVAADAKR